MARRVTSAAAGLVALLLAASVGFADEIRRWRDAKGNVHYSVTGPNADPSDEPDRPQLMRSREASPAERFSVTASLRRREIEAQLALAGDDLTKTRDAVHETESRQVVVYAPTTAQNPVDAQLALEAQRNAFLAERAFEHDQADQLRRLHRHERERLREIIDLWKQFAALDSEVLKRYGVSPSWWRGRLDCGRCPTREQAEEALKGRPEQPAGE